MNHRSTPTRPPEEANDARVALQFPDLLGHPQRGPFAEADLPDAAEVMARETGIAVAADIDQDFAAWDRRTGTPFTRSAHGPAGPVVATVGLPR